MDPLPLWNAVVGATSSAGHFYAAIYFACGFGALRLLLDLLVFQRLAVRVLYDGVNLLKIDETRRTKIVKFTESMWKLTYYLGVELWVLVIMYQEAWAKDIREYFRGWPHQELKIPLKLFYMCQCGFYLYSIAALVTWETRRKDFSIMMSHHIITSILIGYSYLRRFFRIGSIILALHDACDVFMEAAKIFKYSGKDMGASIFFGLFALSWFLLRLIFFPFWVIRASSYISIAFLKEDEHFTGTYYIFNSMLITLLVFHIYWWILIYSMIRRQLKNSGKVGEDIRSDSEDEN